MPRKKKISTTAKRKQPAQGSQSRQPVPVHHDPRFAPYDASNLRAISSQRAYIGGRRLLRDGLLNNGKLRGQRLEGSFRTVASWWGPDHYRAYAVLPLAGSAFDARSVASSCTCLEEQQPCQHAVALLLAWIERNETITELPGVDQLLGDRSPEELLAIIGKMIEIYPDLESVIALPPPVPGRSPNRATLSPGLIKSTVASALDAYSDVPLAMGGQEPSELTRILSLSVEYGNAGLWADSSLILCEVGEQAIAASRDDDGMGDYEQIFSQCDTGLSICLAKQAELPEPDRLDGEQRARIVRTLYDLWRVESDQDYDDYGDVEPEVVRYGPGAIANFATTAEKVKVDFWLHTEEISSPAHAAEVADFEASLFRGDNQDHEELLAAYVEIELWDRVALTQLNLGRIDDGIATAKRHLRTVDELALFAAGLAQCESGAHLAQAISLIEDFGWEIEGRNPDD
ncbi:MAG TPA: SWIM zinc finger family protein, partial [Thermomicrobiales bacterium]|nr:SWIM zinc finger family protein [Thermomicrobiales bacterium]